MQSPLPWLQTHPELHAWLWALNDSEVATLENDAVALREALIRFVPSLAMLRPLMTLPVAEHLQCSSVPIGFEWGIDGRKWAQVRAFAACIEGAETHAHTRSARFVDWCAGKAHLSRWLALRTDVPCSALEMNPELVAAGNALAHKHGLAVNVIKQDVLADDAAQHIGATTHAVALHACGRLHLQLLRVATKARATSISLAPCCYHLCADDDALLSIRGRSSQLQLRADELHLAVQETVTSGRSRQRQRERESAWRLGFDALQRELRGKDEYLPVPSAPRALLRTEFEQFVSWAAQRKGLSVSNDIRFDHFERIGRRRHAEVSRLALLRHAFRRALELWLVHDRAQFLVDSGYDARISEFCPRQDTPRNVLLEAWRQSG